TNAGTIYNNGGTINIETGQSFSNLMGSVENSGTIISNSSAPVYISGGVFTILAGGSLTASLETTSTATFKNSGNITIPSSGTLKNNGDFSNVGSGDINLESASSFENSGTITNAASIQLPDDTIVENNKTITNSGTISAWSFETGHWFNATTSEFSNAGTIIGGTINLTRDDFVSADSAKYEATSEFTKADPAAAKLAGTVIVESDTKIASDGGEFTFQIGSSGTPTTCSKVISTPMKASELFDSLQKDPGLTISTVPAQVYVGQTNTDFGFEATVSDTAFDGTVSILFAEYTGSPVFDTYDNITLKANTTYLVKAVAKGGTGYKEVEATAPSFIPGYLPLSTGPYLSVTAGLNGTVAGASGITVEPVTGYKVKTSLSGSIYATSVTLKKEDLYDSAGTFDGNFKFGLKRDSDGAETEMEVYANNALLPALSTYVFDVDPPVFATDADADGDGWNTSISNGSVIEAKTLSLRVTDDNLDKAVVSGVLTSDYAFTKTGTSGTLVINTPSGGETPVTVDVLDLAGNSAELTFKLVYPRTEGTATVTIDDIEVGASYEPNLDTNNTSADPTDPSSVKFEYKEKDAADSTYTTTKPTLPGSYTVRATVLATSEFTEAVATDDFAITKKTPSISVTVADIPVGGTVNPSLNTNNTEATPVYEYKVKGADDSTYSTTAPSAEGEYTVRVTLAETQTYLSGSATDDFTITAGSVGETKVEIDDVTVGMSYDPVLTTDNTVGAASAVFEYKVKDADDSTYSTTKPTLPGTYTVRATVPAAGTFAEEVVYDDFTISKLTRTVTVSVPDTVYGADYEPVYSINPDVSDGIAFVYKDNNSGTNEYSSVKPTAPGSYTVMLTLPATDSYEASTAENTFTISKISPTATVAQADVLAGTDYTPVFTTNSDSTAEVTFSYKQKGVDNSAYTVVRPTLPGTYMVQATLAASDTYDKAVAESSFTISYLDAPSPAYTLTGTGGDNGFFTSDVYIKAPEGFSVSTDVSGTWQQLLKYESSIEKVYLKRSSDGALTDAVKITQTIKIDKTAPTVKKATGQDGEEVTLKDGKKIYADEVAVKIHDANLKKVTVNGDNITFSDKNASFKLDPGEGNKTYNIIAKDEAGNKLEMKVKVISAWEKDGDVPSGKKISLEKGKAYKMKSGKWKISGDSTVYSGGRSFYVRNGGEYTFTSAD
ncbi:MAG: hypothetical protein J5842_09100, partial [Lachnospiraceae bacterium]|nr:hypothetical protein [Lachnospiraceae bacterium]